MGEWSTDLERAVATWDTEAARRAIEQMDVHAAYDSPAYGRGVTPLIVAAAGNHFEAVEMLVERGVDLDARDADGNTALLRTNAVRIAAYLLEKGADPHARNDRGRNLLMIAADAAAKHYVKMAELALAHGVDKSLRDAEGRTALKIAARNPTTNGRDVLRLLLGPKKPAEVLAEVSAGLLGGEAPPALLEALWKEYLKKGASFLEQCGEVEVIASADEGPAAYVAEGGPDSARWRAMFEQLAFFAAYADGHLLAFWRQPPGTPLDRAPVVMLDNEGQLSVRAANLADFLVLAATEANGKSGARKARKWLEKKGVSDLPEAAAMEAARDAVPSPQAVFDQL